MKLYEVRNGYIGESYVRCLVIAKNETLAVDLARPAFVKKSGLYGPGYYEDLTATLLCDETAEGWCGEVNDG